VELRWNGRRKRAFGGSLRRETRYADDFCGRRQSAARDATPMFSAPQSMSSLRVRRSAGAGDDGGAADDEVHDGGSGDGGWTQAAAKTAQLEQGTVAYLSTTATACVGRMRKNGTGREQSVAAVRPQRLGRGACASEGGVDMKRIDRNFLAELRCEPPQVQWDVEEVNDLIGLVSSAAASEQRLGQSKAAKEEQSMAKEEQSMAKKVLSSSSCESKQLSLTDLTGSSAVAVKAMTAEERELVLLKRKLRNRESAKRSRARKELSFQQLAASMKVLEAQLHVQNEQIARLTQENAILSRACNQRQ